MVISLEGIRQEYQNTYYIINSLTPGAVGPTAMFSSPLKKYERH